MPIPATPRSLRQWERLIRCLGLYDEFIQLNFHYIPADEYSLRMLD